MKRLLTMKFGSYAVAQCERKYHKKSILEFVTELSELSMSVILILISAGNNNCPEEKAGEIADRFLAEHSVLELMIQILEELNADINIFEGTGLSIDEIKNQLKANTQKNDDESKVVEFKTPEAQTTELKENESVKVDVNGFASLDTEDIDNF